MRGITLVETGVGLVWTFEHTRLVLVCDFSFDTGQALLLAIYKKIHTSLALVLSPRLIFAWCRGGIDLMWKGDIYLILSQVLYQMGISI